MRRAMAIALALMLLLPGAARAAVVLEVGSSGADVKKVQQKLIDWGYLNGTADGKYGAKTQAAVKRFQNRVGPRSIASKGRSREFFVVVFVFQIIQIGQNSRRQSAFV